MKSFPVHKMKKKKKKSLEMLKLCRYGRNMSNTTPILTTGARLVIIVFIYLKLAGTRRYIECRRVYRSVLFLQRVTFDVTNGPWTGKQTGKLSHFAVWPLSQLSQYERKKTKNAVACCSLDVKNNKYANVYVLFTHKCPEVTMLRTKSVASASGLLQ